VTTSTTKYYATILGIRVLHGNALT